MSRLVHALRSFPSGHPFLATLFPLLFLYAHNADVVGFADVWSTLAVALTATAVVMWLASRVLRDPHRRALVVTLGVLLFYSYGHAVRFAPQATQRRLGVSPEVIAAVLWLVVAGVGLAWIQRTKQRAHTATLAANTLMAALVLVQGGTLVYHTTTTTHRTLRHVASSSNTEPVEHRPDIYFIVLDGYARADVLRELYDYDNSSFVDSLRAMGFQVLEHSRANYCQTILSLAATLNFDYVPRLVEIDSLSRYRRPLHDLINDNRLFAELRSRGYSIVSFASGFHPTELDGVDHYLRGGWSLSEFQHIAISTTPLPLLMRLGRSQYDLHRQRIEFILRELPQIDVGSRPRFTFAHLVTPHPPFVFGPHGEPISRLRPFDFGDGSHYYDAGGSRAEYVGKYRNQLAYVSERILHTLRVILERADKPPVIVLQADHGPGSGLHWWSLPRTDMHERFAVLNALYMPGSSQAIRDDLSLVNTFRLLMDTYFATHLGLLDDRSYYTVLTQPYYYFDVTHPDSVPAWPGGLDLKPVRRTTSP